MVWAHIFLYIEMIFAWDHECMREIWTVEDTPCWWGDISYVSCVDLGYLSDFDDNFTGEDLVQDA